MPEYCKDYSLLNDFSKLRKIKQNMIHECLKAMMAERRFTYTDLFVRH